MGSVFKRGNVYCIRIDLPPGPGGKRRQRRISCKGMNQKEAKAELIRVTAEINGRVYIDPSKLTLEEYLDRWLRDCYSIQVEPTTFQSNAMYVRVHIVPNLGWLPMSALSPLHVQEFYNTLSRKGSRRDGEALSPKTVSNIHGVLHKALKQAVIQRLITSNPADGAALPRRERPKKRSARPEEVAVLLERIKNSRYRLPILTALMTGMRRSEILGLKWEDCFEVLVDGENFHAFRIERAAAYTPELGAFIKATKSRAGERCVLIPHSLAAELREHRKVQIERSSSPKGDYTDNGWIFPTKKGDLVKPPLLGKEFVRLARSVNVDLTIHAFRHTNATIAYEEGVNDLTMQKRLGWANAGMRDVYTHVEVKTQRAAVEAMDSFYEQALALQKKASES